MCGRYLFWDSVNPDLEKLVNYAEETMGENMKNVSVYDACPGSFCFAAVCKNDGSFHTGLMKWGYPKEKRLVINARSETCMSSPFFAGSRPCVLPQCGYYEWDASKTRYLIRAEENTVTYLCGLYRMENGIPVFTVVTQPAHDSIASIHDRQPVVFDKKTAQSWCMTMDASLFSKSLLKRKAIKG